MQLPDQIAVAVLLGAWFALDVGVICVDKSDSHALEYLTNQVWLTAIVSKVLVVVEISQNRKREDCNSVSLLGWFTTALFLIVGAAQAGVLGAFFLLTWLDSSLLDGMLKSGEHTIAEVLVWNHARHVTVCFFHLGILWSMRHYLSYNARKEHALSSLCCNASTSCYRFCWFVLLTPVFGGLLHSQIFDDQKLYKFGDTDVGSACQLAFGAFSVLATSYFLFVPLRAVEMEQKDPSNVAKALIIQVSHLSEQNTRREAKVNKAPEQNETTKNETISLLGL